MKVLALRTVHECHDLVIHCVVLTRGDGGPEEFQGIGTGPDQLDPRGGRWDLRLQVPQVITTHLPTT